MRRLPRSNTSKPSWSGNVAGRLSDVAVDVPAGGSLPFVPLVPWPRFHILSALRLQTALEKRAVSTCGRVAYQYEWAV